MQPHSGCTCCGHARPGRQREHRQPSARLSAPPPPPCISQSDQAQPVLAQALQLPAARQALLQHLRSDQGHQLLADVLKRLPAPGANRSSEQQGAAHVVQLITHAINRDLQALDTD